MRKSHRILTAVAVAGIVFAGGSAFTATGLTSTAGDSQFIGGTVTQTVTGATLTSVEYGFGGEAAQTNATQVELTFAELLEDKTVTVELAGSTATAECLISVTNSTVCTFTGDTTGLTGLSITVDNAPDEV